jgi:hypothetical protein
MGIPLAVASVRKVSARYLPLRLEPCLGNRAVCHVADIMYNGCYVLAEELRDLTRKAKADHQTSDQTRSSPLRSLSLEIVLQGVHQFGSSLRELSILRIRPDSETPFDARCQETCEGLTNSATPVRREKAKRGEPKGAAARLEISFASEKMAGMVGFSYYPFFLTSITIL